MGTAWQPGHRQITGTMRIEETSDRNVIEVRHRPPTPWIEYFFARPAGLFFGDAKDDNQQPGLASAVNAAAMATREAGNEHDRYRDLGAPGAGRCQRISQF